MAKRPFRLYEFDPVIYPRMLWVAIGGTLEDINNYFSEPKSGSIPIKFDLTGCDAVTLRVRDLKTKYLGELIWFLYPSEITVDTKAHEGGHAVFNIMQDIDSEFSFNYQEPYCYLLGWVADCIYKAQHNKIMQKK